MDQLSANVTGEEAGVQNLIERLDANQLSLESQLKSRVDTASKSSYAEVFLLGRKTFT